ncbi:MAG: M28 family peptidase [Opitutales bacterium]
MYFFKKSDSKESALKQILRSARRVALAIVILILIGWIAIAQPSLPFKNNTSEQTVSAELPDRLKAHVRTLSETFTPRSFRHTKNLEAAATYIAEHFESAGGEVSSQYFEVSGKRYRNIRARFGPAGDSLLIVGAHYDAYNNSPGADDNASGVAGLIELAYLLGQTEPAGEVELVAYALEEPPFFGTKHMGSYHHANHISDHSLDVAGVIILEMIGYFSDEPGSQDYPARLFKLFYPNTGNFIGIVGKLQQRPFTKTVKRAMQRGSALPAFSVNAPTNVPGIDFSDHRNYWDFGYNAVMITDTAFYRNKAYHTEDDTWSRLDYIRMTQVVQGVYHAILSILESP